MQMTVINFALHIKLVRLSLTTSSAIICYLNKGGSHLYLG
jgi:hypothetical protein